MGDIGMHTEVFHNIDLLVSMAGSLLNTVDIEAKLASIRKEIEDKKREREDLESLMTEARYFNASSELVDKNIEVSLKSKISRINRKIKEFEQKEQDISAYEEKRRKELASLEEKIKDNKKYIEILESKVGDNANASFQAIIKNEKRQLKALEDEFEQKTKSYQDILKEGELHKQALIELSDQRKNDEDRLKEIKDILNNPNAYIDEDLKQRDQEKLKELNEDLDSLKQEELKLITDPNMIGSEAKELVNKGMYDEALVKIKELLTIVKTKPYMDVASASVLAEELEKKEAKRTELSNYIDSKDYTRISGEIPQKRQDYLEEEINKEKEEIKNYQNLKTALKEKIGKLSDLIYEVETNIKDVTRVVDEYQELLRHKKQSKNKANLENTILKKIKEKEVLNQILDNSKQDLLFQITLLNTIDKIEEKYNKNIDDKIKETLELKRLGEWEGSFKDYVEEEKDKEELRKINEEIKQIKNRQKFDKAPGEVYDQIEMALANMNWQAAKVEDQNKKADLEIDDLFSEPMDQKRIKVVEMIPAQTVFSDGGTTHGA